MKTFEDEVDEMIDIIIKLTWNYTIFCALFENGESDREVRGVHQEFFLTIHDSLLCGFCVAATVIFNERKKSTSLCSLIKEIEKSKPTLATKLRLKLNAGRRPVVELGKVRNQVFAHRWKTKTPQDVFDEVRPSVEMMRGAVELAQYSILQLSEAISKEKRANLEKQHFSKQALQCVADDVAQTMRVLAKLA